MTQDGRPRLKGVSGSAAKKSSTHDEPHLWPDDLFPLPLTYFENYMLVDDRPTHPMSIFVDIRLSGDLQRDAFESAYQQTLDRHPLLQCVVKKYKRRWCWTPACHLVPSVVWTAGSQARLTADQAHLDLEIETGLRTWVEYQPEEARVIFQFHHAATDGLGAVKFIGDLLAIYGQLTTPEGEEAPELLPVTFDRLRDRGQLWAEGQSRLASFRRVLECTWEFMTQVPKPLAAPPPPRLHERDELGMPNMASRRIDKGTTKAIKREAAKRMVSANDLYSLVLFQSMRRWNEVHNASGQQSTMRIGVPVTLRTPHHEDSPAANILSYMALTSFADDDSEQLLKRITQRAAQTVGGVDGPVFTLGVGGVMTHLPWIGRYCSNRPNYCFTTAVLTNIGEVRRAVGNRFTLKKGRCVAGNVTLEALFGTAPVRPQTAVAIALGTYGGHLYINANCDPYHFSNADVDAFLDLYVNTLQALVEDSEQVLKKSA